MSGVIDVGVKPVGLVENRAVKNMIAYLVSLEDGKKENYFISTRLDDLSAQYIKLIGFYYEGKLENLYANYDEIIKATDKSFFVEMMFPWQRVKSIRSLIYRQK